MDTERFELCPQGIWVGSGGDMLAGFLDRVAEDNPFTMPIKHAIWTVGAKPAALALGQLGKEKQLEDIIVAGLESALKE